MAGSAYLRMMTKRYNGKLSLEYVAYVNTEIGVQKNIVCIIFFKTSKHVFLHQTCYKKCTSINFEGWVKVI